MAVMEDRDRAGARIPAPSHPPLRGTQSFVSVMAQVWKRPGLAAIELLWRWIVGVPLLLLAWHAGSRALLHVPFDLAALEAMTVFKPSAAVATMTHQLAVTLPPLLPIAHWLLPLALVAWTIASTLGRTAIWRRLDPGMRERYLIAGILGLARTLLLVATYAVWVWGLVAAARYAVTGPAAGGAEPNLVLYVALIVALTLLLFMFWSLTTWVLDAAPLFAMSSGRGLGASLRRALQTPHLASKLIEINLVMGIVKLALLVLAMVFSACPLPFASVETTGFLLMWWSFVGVVFLVFLDLFHVIRRAAYLALFRAIVTSAPDADHPRATSAADTTPTARSAS